MKRLLFVDDDPNILMGLKRMLRPMRNQWDVSFAPGPHEAVAMLDESRYDVVVTDMRMPEMSGVELLGKVRESHPSVARIILSGHTQMELAVKSAGVAHQFLAKPCDAETLKRTISRSLELRRLLSNDALAELVAGLGALPSPPATYTAIRIEVAKENPSLKHIAQIVASDVAMAAKTLQLVNSAFFGLARRIDSIEQAVTLLGIDVIQSLVLSNGAFSQFESSDAVASIERLWRHSTETAALAAAIAKSETSDKAAIGETLQAGMLHDIGQLVLASRCPMEYLAAVECASQRGIPLHEAELATFGATHAHVGAYLLGLWGLPDGTVEALAYHHSPSESTLERLAPLVAVHAANALLHSRLDGKGPSEAQIDVDFLERIGMSGRESAWLELVNGIQNPNQMGSSS